MIGIWFHCIIQSVYVFGCYVTNTIVGFLSTWLNILVETSGCTYIDNKLYISYAYNCSFTRLVYYI